MLNPKWHTVDSGNVEHNRKIIKITSHKRDNLFIEINCAEPMCPIEPESTEMQLEKK